MTKAERGLVVMGRVTPNYLLLGAMLHFVNETLPYVGGFQSMEIKLSPDEQFPRGGSLI